MDTPLYIQQKKYSRWNKDKKVVTHMRSMRTLLNMRFMANDTSQINICWHTEEHKTEKECSISGPWLELLNMRTYEQALHQVPAKFTPINLLKFYKSIHLGHLAFPRRVHLPSSKKQEARGKNSSIRLMKFY
mgnify:FL=1